MKVSDILASSRKPFASIEIVPPLKGVTKSDLLESIGHFMEFRPPFINVTTHRDEYEFIDRGDGSFSRVLTRRRLSCTAVCAVIQEAFDVEVVPHVICAGATAEQIECQLHDFKFIGIENIMALRGDSMTSEKRFTPEPGGYRYASELVKAIKDFESKTGFSFCTGAGAYPEKHFEAPNAETDILNLKKKVDAGADYIITQMFFDNKVFYEFREKCRQAGINVPIIPGLKPLSTPGQIELLPQAFSIDIPADLVNEVTAHRDSCYRIGQEWCTEQCRDLLNHGVPAVHFYTMGRPDNVTGILKELF